MDAGRLVRRPLHWIGSSRDDIRDMPEQIKDEFGYALDRAQVGEKHPAVKPLNGFGNAGVMEIVAHGSGGTYRAVYTVRFAAAVYVLHVFQKKSKRGIATPIQDIARVRRRLAYAEQHYREHYA